MTGHTFLEHRACGVIGCPICDGGLAVCQVCGGAKTSLTSECPERRIGERRLLAIFVGDVDFKDGEWTSPVVRSSSEDHLEQRAKMMHNTMYRSTVLGDWKEAPEAAKMFWRMMSRELMQQERAAGLLLMPMETEGPSHVGMLAGVDEAQQRVADWVRNRLGDDVHMSRHERATRVLEEAAELAQAEDVGWELAQRVVGMVYDKPLGRADKEAAGVCVTLLAWAAAAGENLWQLMETELQRINSQSVEEVQRRCQVKVRAGVAMETNHQEQKRRPT